MNRCPIDPQIISRFEVNADRTQATATLRSMFKFPEGKCDLMMKAIIMYFSFISYFFVWIVIVCWDNLS